MSYSCSDFTDTVLDVPGITVPDDMRDSPSDQADLAIAEITRLQAAATASAAAPDMLAALVNLVGNGFTDEELARRWSWSVDSIRAARAAVAKAEAQGRSATVAPGAPVDLARSAVAHLTAARDLLKRVGASRTVDRVRLAISSAKGAVRHAEHRRA